MRLNLSLGRKKVAAAGFNRSAEKSRVAESLVRSASRLLERRNDRDVIHSVCESLTVATPHVRLAWTWFGPVDTPRIVPQVVVGPAADYARKLSIDRSFFTEIGSAFRTLAGKKVEPFNVSRMSLYGPWREAAAIHGIRCSLVLPLASTVNNDRGLLALYADQPDYFEQVGIGLFEALADMFSSVLSAATERVQLREAACSDALTGLLNRHAVDVVAQPILRTDGFDPQATVLVIDVDHFKRANDDYGHAGGDALLCSVADRLRRGLRKGDNVLRWGGEEFLVCLPRTDLASATLVAYKMLDAVGQHPHALPDGRSTQLTVSIGVAELGIAEPFIAAVERADTALYEAKRQGRNRVCKAPAMAASGNEPEPDARSVPERQSVTEITRSRASLP
ncbi:MAG: GGDEF domain-containing protein [Burkholderiaceae bacterium]|nr:GGDEF domain-containing protein [Burkholderiaceae bacterium]